MNENENTAVCLPPCENSITEDAKVDEPLPHPEVSGESDKNEICEACVTDIQNSEQRSSFVRQALRFVCTKLLPIVLALFSTVVTLSLAASFFGDLELDAKKLVRIMLGDFAGGADFVIDAGEDYAPRNPPNNQLESDDRMYTADKNVPPSETSPQISILSNETPYTPDMGEILDMPRAVPPLEELYETYGDGAPIVLIIHTHATESFADTAADGYRSLDAKKSIIAVGKVIADKLVSEGISTIHCTEVFDSPDFGMAYYNASQAIRSYINEYPSISYILDIHRDSIELDDGTSYAPTSITSLGRAAQIMFVVGTDHGGSDHTGWRDNLALAARVQEAASGDYPTLMRSINLRSASFNEQYTKGSLLIEVGAAASTLDEAKLGAKILAEYLAREIIG